MGGSLNGGTPKTPQNDHFWWENPWLLGTTINWETPIYRQISEQGQHFLITLPETFPVSLDLKIDSWKTMQFPFGTFRPIFRGRLLFCLKGGTISYQHLHEMMKMVHMSYKVGPPSG